MELITPWKTTIAKINVADRYDMDAFANETFTLYAMTGGEDATQYAVSSELLPVTVAMRDDVITPAIRQLSMELFNDPMDSFYVETNGKWIEEGTGLYPHYHPGSVLSAICYPRDSQNGMTMFDPRGNACRGYPKPMRQHHFANFKISPKAGDIYLFPSYIQHSVSHVTEETRLSLLHEYYMTKHL
jgi:hypothetical protein